MLEVYKEKGYKILTQGFSIGLQTFEAGQFFVGAVGVIFASQNV